MGDSTQLPAPALRLPGGKEVAGHAVPDQKPSPHMRWVFNVNADELAPGSNTLLAVTKDAAGREVRSEPVYVNVIRPDAAATLSGCARTARTPTGPRMPARISPT